MTTMFRCILAACFACYAVSASAQNILSADDIPKMTTLNRSNEIAFARSYKGRTFSAQGVFSHAAAQVMGPGIRVTFEAGGQTFVCTFGPAMADQIASWTPAMTFSVSGIVDDTIFGDLLLNDCRIGAQPASSAPLAPVFSPPASSASSQAMPAQVAPVPPPYQLTPATVPPPPPSTPYPPAMLEGYTDRLRYEHWFSSLSGAERDGAAFWAENRWQREATCPTNNPTFYSGCAAAKDMLAQPDRRRRSEPVYRAGWNALP